MRDTMRSSQQPSRSIVSIQRGLSSVLIFTLAFAVACTKKEMPPSQATSTGPSHRNEPGDISYLPQDIFGPQAAAGATELKPVDIRSLSDTELKYGIAPKRTSNVEYNPDVIVIEHGDKAIRSVSSNGLEVEFDASAEHVSEFQEDKIVFATGRAVGRIISLKKEGNSVKAFLGPIQLTDVIKNGKFKLNSAISADNMISYVAPDFPNESDPQPHDKTSFNRDQGESEVERAVVVVSSIHNGVWMPMSLAESYPDGRQATFHRAPSALNNPSSSRRATTPTVEVFGRATSEQEDGS